MALGPRFFYSTGNRIGYADPKSLLAGEESWNSRMDSLEVLSGATQLAAWKSESLRA